MPQDKGEELAKQLNFSGYISVDIAQPDSVEAAAKKTLELLNSVKLVGCVHCAGIALRVSVCLGVFKRFSHLKIWTDMKIVLTLYNSATGQTRWPTLSHSSKRC